MSENYIHIDNITEDRAAVPARSGSVRVFRWSWTA